MRIIHCMLCKRVGETSFRGINRLALAIGAGGTRTQDVSSDDPFPITG